MTERGEGGGVNEGIGGRGWVVERITHHNRVFFHEAECCTTNQYILVPCTAVDARGTSPAQHSKKTAKNYQKIQKIKHIFT